MAKTILPHSWFPAPQNLGHQLSVGRKTPTPHLAGPWDPPRHRPSSWGGLPQAPGARHPPTTTTTPRTDIFPPAPFACSRLCPGSLPVPSSSQHARLGAAAPPPGSLSPPSLLALLAVRLHHRSPSPASGCCCESPVPVPPVPGTGTGLSDAPPGCPFAILGRGAWGVQLLQPPGIKPGIGSQAFCSCSLIPGKAEGIWETSDGVLRWTSSQRSWGYLRAHARRESSSVH